eukprot:984299-Prymnesium_polylepis.1
MHYVTTHSAKTAKRAKSPSTAARIASGTARSDAWMTRSSIEASLRPWGCVDVSCSKAQSEWQCRTHRPRDRVSETNSNSSWSSGTSSRCHVSGISLMAPPASASVSGRQPHRSTASRAAGGGASSRLSQPALRSKSSSDASCHHRGLSVPHCTSEAPSRSERMRVVTTTAERGLEGLTKLRGVAFAAFHTSSRISRTERLAAASLSASSVTSSSPLDAT